MWDTVMNVCHLGNGGLALRNYFIAGACTKESLMSKWLFSVLSCHLLRHPSGTQRQVYLLMKLPFFKYFPELIKSITFNKMLNDIESRKPDSPYAGLSLRTKATTQNNLSGL